MFQLLKRFWLVLLLVFAGVRPIFGFALLGPINEAFQINTIGYAEAPPASSLGDIGGGVDIGAPKNLGEGYRWNTRNLYYAYDASFLDYFGSNGVVAVDQAFAVLNSLTNVSAYSSDLSEWPLNASRVNYRAQALQLLDLKSAALHLLIEQLGLAQPERWMWCIEFRIPGPMCPIFSYNLIERNYDPVTHYYSSYVNGVLYDYEIEEFCNVNPNPVAPLLADALEFVVDPTEDANSFNTVATSIPTYGTFFTSLTRDDVGGLRYLYASTNANVETVDTNSLQILTNQFTPQLLTTTNLALFTAQALTNPPAALQALYPNLLIASSTNFFVNVSVTNITAFLTNFPNSPAGQATLVFVTNVVPGFLQEFSYVFGNVVTNHVYTNGYISFQTNTVYFPPNAPAGFFVTNFISSTILTPMTNGDIYIIPTNFCGFDFLPNSPGFTNGISTVVTNTNAVVIAVNFSGVTNIISSTFNILTYSTNYTYVVDPVLCVTNSASLREGIEKISFIRRDFDSLLNNFWSPITNTYTLTAITNNAPMVQVFRRVVTTPDIVISAADLGAAAVSRTTNNYNTNQILPGLAGPGTLSSEPTAVNLTFNKDGPFYINGGPFFGGGMGQVAIYVQTNSFLNFIWGSFDGSTNDPVVYPSSTSLASLEAQAFFQISTALLPNGSVSGNTGTNLYSAQLQATGAQPPYTWSLAPASAGLPDGLTLSAGGVISGVPTTTGVFDFTVQASDIGARVTQKDLFIEIDP